MRIVLMYYVDFYSLFEHPESDWEAMFEPKEAPQEPNLFGWGLTKTKSDEIQLIY